MITNLMVIGTKLNIFYKKVTLLLKKSLQLIWIVPYSKFKGKKSIDFLSNQTKCKNLQKQQQSNKGKKNNI